MHAPPPAKAQKVHSVSQDLREGRSVHEVVHVSPKEYTHLKLTHAQTGQVNVPPATYSHAHTATVNTHATLPPATFAHSPTAANRMQPTPQWGAASMFDGSS